MVLLHSSIFLEGNDKEGSSRIERAKQFVAWYKNLQTEIGFDEFLFTDNASSVQDLAQVGIPFFKDSLPLGAFPFSTLSFSERLTTSPGPNSYPYCWRNLYYLDTLAKSGRYEKIISIDSDMYVLTPRLSAYLKNLSSGWIAFWAPRYRFPESAFHVICKDAFPILSKFCETPYEKRYGQMMETVTPYTQVELRFMGDRYGEWRPLREQTPEMDYFGQKPTSLTLRYNLL